MKIRQSSLDKINREFALNRPDVTIVTERDRGERILIRFIDADCRVRVSFVYPSDVSEVIASMNEIIDDIVGNRSKSRVEKFIASDGKKEVEFSNRNEAGNYARSMNPGNGVVHWSVSSRYVWE